jgi:penicillin amidase
MFNPDTGKIVSANNKMVGDDYPYFLGVEFDPGWRANRIEAQLCLKERYTLRDMEEMQVDTFSKYAQTLTPWLTLMNSDDPWEKVALAALRKWNFRMDAESEAPTVFHYTLIQLLEMVFGDKLGALAPAYFGMTANPLFLIHGFISRAEANLLDLLNNQEQSVWYMDAATGKARSREELLQEALSRAIKKLRGHTGDSARLWSWGRLHQVRYVHPLGSARLLRNIFNRGPFPVGGDGASPFVARHAPQTPIGLVQVTACYRQIFEVGAWDRAQSVLNIGQSGHPLSPHYDNQIVMWREGVYHPMPWSEEAVRAATAYRMVLRPPTA